MIPILQTLERLWNDQEPAVERWLQARRAECPPFFYSSVDLRHCGFRLAPVDTNLFPAGFHHLSARARERTARFIARLLEESYPGAKKALIVPENHTRNLAYLDNLSALLEVLEKAGMQARLGSLAALPGEPVRLQSSAGAALVEHPLVRAGDALSTEEGFTPDVVILNNDMTSGPAELLAHLAQPILPPMERGWYRRRKSVHFAAYDGLARQFAETFGIDSWLLNAKFHACGQVDFKERAGIDRVARAVDALIADAREKHREYGLADDPYVFIKADSGTYGMGIMTARSGSDVIEMNKKERNKMHVVKEGARVSEVIIQEGIPTVDLVDGKPAEPMVYLIDGLPTGGIYRVNGARDALSNLNATGMEFTGMCDEHEDECGRWKAVRECNFHAFGLVAALAALAAAREHYGADYPPDSRASIVS